MVTMQLENGQFVPAFEVCIVHAKKSTMKEMRLIHIL